MQIWNDKNSPLYLGSNPGPFHGKHDNRGLWGCFLISLQNERMGVDMMKDENMNDKNTLLHFEL